MWHVINFICATIVCLYDNDCEKCGIFIYGANPARALPEMPFLHLHCINVDFLHVLLLVLQDVSCPQIEFLSIFDPLCYKRVFLFSLFLLLLLDIWFKPFLTCCSCNFNSICHMQRGQYGNVCVQTFEK